MAMEDYVAGRGKYAREPPEHATTTFDPIYLNALQTLPRLYQAEAAERLEALMRADEGVLAKVLNPRKIEANRIIQKVFNSIIRDEIITPTEEE